MKILLLVVLALMSWVDLWSEDRVLAEADRLLQQVREEKSRRLEEAVEQRRRLDEKLQALMGELDRSQAEVSRLQQELRTRTARRMELEKSTEIRRAEEREARRMALEMGRELLARIQTAPSFHRDMERLDRLEKELDHEPAHLPQRFGEIFGAALEELQQAGRVLRYRGKIASVQGEAVDADILLIGRMQAYFSSGDALGCLKAVPGGRWLHAVPDAQISREALAPLFGATHLERAPLDITSQALAWSEITDRGWQEWFASGGLVAWPILALALALVGLGLERIWVLARVHTRAEIFMAEISSLLDAGRWQDAEMHCERRPWALARMVMAGLRHRSDPREVMENAMNEAILHELPRLEKNLSALSVIAAAAPLLGLLGTVTGIITTFDVISFFGSGDAKLMAGGISEALVTTEMGLVVAIPALLLHNILSSVVDHRVSDMEKYSATLANRASRSNRPPVVSSLG